MLNVTQQRTLRVLREAESALNSQRHLPPMSEIESGCAASSTARTRADNLFGEDNFIWELQLIKLNEPTVRSLDLNDRNATPPLKWNCLLKCKK